ncbi:MAG: hypothetical protein AAF939_01110 [Planctomycetota bacterium]
MSHELIVASPEGTTGCSPRRQPRVKKHVKPPSPERAAGTQQNFCLFSPPNDPGLEPNKIMKRQPGKIYLSSLRDSYLLIVKTPMG